MSDTPLNLSTVNDQEGVAITTSPTGTAIIPAAAVPYVLAGSAILAVVGEDLASPGPWTTPRIVGLAVKVLALLAAGATPGVRK